MKKLLLNIYDRVVHNMHTTLIALVCIFVFVRYSTEIDILVIKMFGDDKIKDLAIKGLEFGIPALLLLMKDRK